MTEIILLVEDDTEIATIICDMLRREGYAVTWATTGLEGWEDFQENCYDLVLVDLMLPEMDGFTLCKNIRLASDVPMIIISARTEDIDKVHGLNLGADDYISKPFSLVELKARVNSHLRRWKRYQGETIEANLLTVSGKLIVDLDKQLIKKEGVEILLTAKEFALFKILLQNPQRTFSKDELYEHVWQELSIDSNHTVTVHIRSLREKLNDDAKHPTYIETVWGKGYRFIGDIE